MTSPSIHGRDGSNDTLPTNHVTDELLAAYAAGNLSEAQSLLVATHSALCPECRAAIAEFEAVGASFLEEIAPESMRAGSLDSVLARLDQEEMPANNVVQHPSSYSAPDRQIGEVLLPQPLRGYVGSDLRDVTWRPVIRGLEEAELKVSGPEFNVRLIKVAAGAAMPQHSHQGEELTLVLTGAYQDGSGRFARGDVQIADGDVDHQPTAEPDEACVCLIITDAPIKLTGRLGRLLNPFIRY
ncbi:ChrR family anti-sigma-E factor [Pelagibius sp. Alg239-R121]|uniref:ChrR family anti-sigma-E factor n=1 Tax=Pelagibius sp. Alg239-R121 TaxID=2993448 RepID=UPI0024A78DDC|nr:ChrR family anti-sigma-E factor [Pelagibius sp. Alg239-R121]